MAERTQKLIITINENYREALISELLDMDFEAFDETNEKLEAFIPIKRFNDVHRERIEQLLQVYPGDNRIDAEEEVANQNWNATWEATITPQVIGPFWVAPTWSGEEPLDDLIPLYVDPKMAFGTGYHETTRLMLKALPDLIIGEDLVLDMGMGTGILGIAAIKLGAKHVVGIDIDPDSYQNAEENRHLNEVAKNFEVRQGSAEQLRPGENFDVILANINRNAITEILDQLLAHLAPNGRLLLSGLLATDEAYIRNLPMLEGYDLQKKWQENEWIALLLERSVKK